MFRILIFLLINFGALGLGGFLMGEGPMGEWYQSVNKAPWTPPGWVFGAAWTLIMICFSIYMAQAWNIVENRKTLLILFGVQLILNIGWNPIFFMFHQALAGLLVISALTILVGFILIRYYVDLKSYSLLLLPYFIWLLIAISLNAFVYLKN